MSLLIFLHLNPGELTAISTTQYVNAYSILNNLNQDIHCLVERETASG